MGKLYASRTLLGNIALVVFLAFLATLTFGVVHPAPAGAEQTLPKEEFQVDPDHPVAIQDKDGKWIKDFTQKVKIKTGIDGTGGTYKTYIDFTIQVLTPNFDNIMLMILGEKIYGKDLSKIANVVYNVYDTIYNNVYAGVYYVYQLVYHWVYQSGLLNPDEDYILHVCSNGVQLASITLDLEAPPPEVEYTVPPNGVLAGFELPADKTAVIKGEGGVELEIAPGTFSGAATVTVKAVDKTSLPGASQIGQVTEIKIEDVNLTKPVTVRLPVGDVTGNRIRAFKLDEASNKWVNLGGNVTGGMVEFSVSSFSKFTVADSPAPPTAQPDPGTYSGSVTVTLTAGEGDSIYYSTDGTAPAKPYTGPLTFTSSTTLRALAERNSIQSEVAVYNYTITSGGGGGGGGAPPPSTGVSTDTGTLTTTAEGQATLTVDDKKVESLAADPKVTEVVFAIPADKAAQQGTVAVTADTLAKVFEAGKPAVVKVADVQLTLPPGAIDLSVFKGQGVTMKINIGKAQVAAPGDAAYKVAGDAYEIVIRAEAGGADKGGISSLAKPVTLTLPYDPAKLAGVLEDYLGIYRLAGSTWEYVGGKVDRAARKVSVERTSLSTYAVMAYDKNFADMVNHWAQSDVKLMAAKHIAGGVTETTFAPNASVTRAEFAAFLLRAMNVAEQKATGSRFKDVAAGAWYAGAVETAAAQGLVGGYPDGTFKPNAPITREELAAMITRALAKSGKDTALSEAGVQAQLGRFADAGKIGPWARQAMAVAIKEGIVNGRLADQCVPKANATRAEAVVMVKRFLTATGRL
ncbi:S-layer homology domain-containing protein [Desulfofundulus thermosubterraneus]|uniref:S-layer homology domain-containing protein n=1 Tax=Desulfofundulus thermosubterraneus DSM 16057 TaxID=1121432 RepID=A0A1M6LQ64_9FIRM|nr:S-layer homology domain-containing protein [Desulfofundulus thermosubterraneus]SHJ73347.1 S-layer homology domain-containing protein [Desulfofundulus thermosubterraneus DSM 16057]